MTGRPAEGGVAGLAAVLVAAVVVGGAGGTPGGGPGGSEASSRPPAGPTAGAPTAGDVDPLTRLLGLRPPPPGRADSAVRTLRRGMVLLEEGRRANAADSVAAAAPDLRPAADWVRLARARLAAAAGDTLAVRRLVGAADSAASPRWARAAAVTARDSANAPASAARAAIAWSRAASGGEERSRALFRAGVLFARAGEGAEARDALRRSIEAEPGAESALEAARKLADRPELAAEEHRAVARARGAHGDWERAHVHLERYLEATGTETAGRGEARLEYARALLRADRYLATVRAVEGLADDAPELAAEALYLEARARLRYGGDADGIRHLELVARRYPDHPSAGRALAELASHAQDEGRRDDARRYWIRAARHAESAESAELWLVRGAALTYLAGDYDSAAALFDGRSRDALRREDRQRSLYWSALAERRAGRADRARTLLERVIEAGRFSYYGTRAAEMLGRPLLPADLPRGPSTPERLTGELDNAVLRLRVAEALGLEGAVATEAERLESHFRRHRRGLYALSEAMSAGGFPLRGVRASYGLREEGDPDNLRLLRARYPFPYREEVRRAAESHRLSPFVVAGVIRQESLFQEEIESDAGAIGLMQIMPGTGRHLARGQGLRGFRTVDLRSPGLNLRLGVGYLRELLTRFEGRLPYALAAYNAGPSRMVRWRREPFARDLDVFVEGIPFRQTRGYVKAVLSNARIYAALYGCGSDEPCLGEQASLALRGGGAVSPSEGNR